MLREVTEGVLIHKSEFLQTNAVVVHGLGGVLLIDPGVRGDEMSCIANDLSDLGQNAVAGFSTHPHWDHLLWHASLGAAPRYGTARCAATVRARLPGARARARIAELIPPDIVEQVPLDLLGLITGLPAETEQIPWDGPQVRIIEHRAHAPVISATRSSAHRRTARIGCLACTNGNYRTSPEEEREVMCRKD